MKSSGTKRSVEYNFNAKADSGEKQKYIKKQNELNWNPAPVKFLSR